MKSADPKLTVAERIVLRVSCSLHAVGFSTFPRKAASTLEAAASFIEFW